MKKLNVHLKKTPEMVALVEKYVNFPADYFASNEEKLMAATMQKFDEHDQCLLALYTENRSYRKCGQVLGCSSTQAHKVIKEVMERAKNVMKGVRIADAL